MDQFTPVVTGLRRVILVTRPIDLHPLDELVRGRFRVLSAARRERAASERTKDSAWA
jgi:hypothetical protein